MMAKTSGKSGTSAKPAGKEAPRQPNAPSTTRKPSGSGRGNNPRK